MNNTPGIIISTTDIINNFQFEDVFNLEDIQRFQDLFSDVSSIASIMTHPDGIPITKPSNYCRLCDKIVSKTNNGLVRCCQPDAIIGRNNPSKSILWPCQNKAFWNLGATIIVGDKHLANWLTGKVMNKALKELIISIYANETKVNLSDLVEALSEVPEVTVEQSNKVSELLFSFAKELSEKGNNKLQLKIQISKQEKIAEELRENEEKFHYYFENAKDILFRTNLAGNIIDISHSIKDITEYDKDELIGIPVSNLYYDPIDREILLEALKKNGSIREYEFRMKTKTGKLKYVSISANLISGANDNQKHIVGSLRDVTERKLTEEILIESVERYRSLFENMLNGYAYCQMLFENGQPSDFIYLNVNKAFEILTGLKNVEGKRVTEVIPGVKESDNNLFEIYGRVALTGKPEFFEMHVESLKDWYSVSVYSPKNEFFIAVFDVITERKLSEQELINAKEKAEESDRLKTAFLNNISHEIRTPFNGILGFLSIIQDHDLPDDEREEYINIINQSADRLMNTINDIVEVSHIQSGIVKLTVQETNIKKLLDELFHQFNTIAESKGLEFNINNDLPNIIASISTDGIKLKTILSNLIGNAMKFTKAGSIELGIRKKSDYLEFSVKDTGIGISKNKQLIIFERFMQADASNIRQFEGLGLGLSIAKEYVKMLGGELWLESEEGKGTTFYFILPYDAKPE